MANLYKRYMRLLDKWPLDPSKTPDLGQHLREQIKVHFPKGERSVVVNKEQCLKNLESLERLASNEYGKKYPIVFSKTSTGLEKEVINVALSEEFQKEIQQQQDGFIAKVKRSISRIFEKPE